MKNKTAWCLLGFVIVLGAVGKLGEPDAKEDNRRWSAQQASKARYEEAARATKALMTPERVEQMRVNRVPTGLPISEAQFQREVEARSSKGTMMKHGVLHIMKYERGSIIMEYWFRPKYSPTRMEIEMTAGAIAMFGVEVLMAHGHNPRTERTLIIVHPHKEAPASLTGAARQHIWGKAIYDYNKDKVEFELARR